MNRDTGIRAWNIPCLLSAAASYCVRLISILILLRSQITGNSCCIVNRLEVTHSDTGPVTSAFNSVKYSDRNLSDTLK